MRDNIIVKGISEETLAAYFDGVATKEECEAILAAIAEDDELREIVEVSMAVDRDLALGVMASQNRVEILPVAALAAACEQGSICCLECERYVMQKRGIECSSEELLADAEQNRWLKTDGTALHNVGRHLENHGLTVTRRFKCSINDIVTALAAGESVIVAVDGGELTGNIEAERCEDIFEGEIPDHTVVVLACDTKQQTVTVFDPNSPNDADVYNVEQFRDAWDDSKNYMVTVCNRGSKPYSPQPINLDDVVLKDDITELREAIAENAHEIWAYNRMCEGWSYGPKRDDKLMQTPDMVPYTELPDQEKNYDRNMAMQTIKLVYKLGYDIVKYRSTKLYAVLKQRLQSADRESFCPCCGAPMYEGQCYCDRCGEKLM